MTSSRGPARPNRRRGAAAGLTVDSGRRYPSVHRGAGSRIRCADLDRGEARSAFAAANPLRREWTSLFAVFVLPASGTYRLTDQPPLSGSLSRLGERRSRFRPEVPL